MSFISDLDTPLLKLSDKDHFSLRDACTGVQVFGAIGSGKTSGAGRALAGAYLRAGMGGLVLCAKPEEVELWKRYCEQHGRKDSMILFAEKAGCNFIDYEFARKGGTDAAASVTDTLMRVLEAADMAAGQSGKQGEQFWLNTTRQMILYTVAALYAATGNVTASNIVKFVTTMPTRNPATEEEKAALDKNFAVNILHKLLTNPAREIPADLKDAVINYWRLQYLALPDKTRGSIVINVTACLNRFNSGLLRKCFCDRTTVLPEMTFSGAIIIMALPALTYNENGIVAQQLFKFLWMRAVESRNALDPQFRERAVFLYADESQYFVSSYDDQFLSTCRGSKACVVYLTQSLPTYYAMLGRDKTDAVDGFVGKFNSKIFHLNADPRTNSYASSLIGRGLQIRRTASETAGTSTQRGRSYGSSESVTHTLGDTKSRGSQQGYSGIPSNFNRGVTSQGSAATQRGSNSGYSLTEGENQSVTSGGNEQMDTLVETNFFSQHLKTGGPDNNHEVTALWFKAGGKFNRPMPGVTNNVILATFKQEP